MPSDKGTGGKPICQIEQCGTSGDFYKAIETSPAKAIETPPAKDSISPHPDDILEERLQVIENSLARIENRLKLIFGDFVLDRNGRFIRLRL